MKLLARGVETLAKLLRKRLSRAPDLLKALLLPQDVYVDGGLIFEIEGYGAIDLAQREGIEFIKDRLW